MWGYGVARRKKKIRIFYSIVWRKSFFTDWHACWRRTMRIRLTYPQWSGAKKLRRAFCWSLFIRRLRSSMLLPYKRLECEPWSAKHCARRRWCSRNLGQQKPITADIVELAKMMKEARISRVEVRMEKIEVYIRESKMSRVGHAFSALARSYPENTHVLPIEWLSIQGVRRGLTPTFTNSADAPSGGSHGSQARAYKFQELGATQNKSTDTTTIFGSNSAETEFKKQNGKTYSSNDGTTIDSNSAQNELTQTEIKQQMQSRDSTNNSESSYGNSDQSMTTQTESQEQT
uniref:Uncharacterized protein n=1 Tax=Tanacetum cinerariifolium TaxID=118510 RepID=A0A6L2KTR0_TANCI|nr:hypothetical protein [Tanacetum cinerariifolium]